MIACIELQVAQIEAIPPLCAGKSSNQQDFARHKAGFPADFVAHLFVHAIVWSYRVNHEHKQDNEVDGPASALSLS